MAENALVPVAQYAVMTMQDSLAEILQENLGGGSISMSDLDRVKFPSGGSLYWLVPSISGETPERYIEGVVIFQKDSRVYFDKPFSESNGEPPMCYSDDAQTGMMLEGDPEANVRHAQSCATCPFSQWGSAKNGKGQACSLNKNLYMISKDGFLPIHVRIPTASYQVIKQDLLLRLIKTNPPIPYYGAIVKLGLKEEKNAQGIKYAEVKVEDIKPLGGEELQFFRGLHEQFKPMLSQVRTESATFTDGGSGVFGDDEGVEVGGGVDLD